jgi:pantetheine-phosphate adenylyltransferase
MTRTAVFAGSFDPLHLGHVNLIERARALFDEVTVAVALNPGKSPLFTVEERLAHIRLAFPQDPRVHPETFDGLIARFAHERGAVALVRGLRSPSDFDYELPMAGMNQHLAPQVETLFLPTDPKLSYVSSRLVKEVASLGGDVSPFLHPDIARDLHHKLAQRAKP